MTIHNLAFFKVERAKIFREDTVMELVKIAHTLKDRPEGKAALDALKKYGVTKLPPLPEEESFIEDEPQSTYREALKDARRGRIAAAHAGLAWFLDVYEKEEYPAHLALFKRVDAQYRNAAGFKRIKVTRIIDIEKREYHQIGLEIRTNLQTIRNLVVQYYVLTDKDRLFAGFREFRNVPSGRRHRHAAYLPIDMLVGSEENENESGIEKIKNVRIEVYAADELVCRGFLKDDNARQNPRPNKGPAESPDKKKWWKKDKVNALVFLGSFGLGWDSGTMKPAENTGTVYVPHDNE